jgi:hypothetical protein
MGHRKRIVNSVYGFFLQNITCRKEKFSNFSEIRFEINLIINFPCITYSASGNKFVTFNKKINRYYHEISNHYRFLNQLCNGRRK